MANQLQSAWPSIRTLYTSGCTMDLVADHGIVGQGLAFLRKPWTREELAAKVFEAIAGA